MFYFGAGTPTTTLFDEYSDVTGVSMMRSESPPPKRNARHTENDLKCHADKAKRIVMRDRDTGRSRNFGFVTFGTVSEVQGAIDNLHESE